MDRREFIKTAVIATSVVGMTAVTGSKGDLLVVEVNTGVTQEAAKEMIEELERNGVKAIVISNVVDVAVVNQPRTFFSVARNDQGRVIADGQDISMVAWCETSHGLVCQIGNHGERIVKQFDSVRFENWLHG